MLYEYPEKSEHTLSFKWSKREGHNVVRSKGDLRWKISSILPALLVCSSGDVVVNGPVIHLSKDIGDEEGLW